jgi:Na+-translocating ferredoxin:NAD+ oxidoreductase RnfD subunit
MVIHRAMRSDVSYAFILTFAAILFARALWLGDPWTIPLKQLQSRALLLFTFFMISDPKTTPDS